MAPGFVDEALQLSFPHQVQSIEQKVLYTLWREGAQCIANIGVLASLPTPEVTNAVRKLATKGEVEVAGSDFAPLTVCQLNRVLVKRLTPR